MVARRGIKDPLVHITRFHNQRDAHAVPQQLYWEELAGLLAKVVRTNCAPCKGKDCDAKFGNAWSPAIFREQKRAKANVISLSVAVFDLDDVTDQELATIGMRLDGYKYLIHSTHAHYTRSNAAHEPLGRYRLVLDVSRDILAEEWERFRQRVVQLFRLPADENAADASRLFFLPSVSSEGDFLFDRGDGRALNVDEILDLPYTPPIKEQDDLELENDSVPLDGVPAGTIDRQALLDSLGPKATGPLRAFLTGKAFAKEGGRDNALSTLLAKLSMDPVGRTIDEDGIQRLAEPSLRATPGVLQDGLSKWVGITREKWSRHLRTAGDRLRAADETRTAALSVVGGDPASIPYWPDLDQYANGKVKPNEANIRHILQHDEAWKGALEFDTLRKEVIARAGPLVGKDQGQFPYEVTAWLQRSALKVDATAAVTKAAILNVALANSVDPLKEYLEGCRWDGIPRIDRFFVEDVGIEFAPHVPLLSRKWLLSCAARGLYPGCKMDTMLILTGAYGTKKSTFIQTMATKAFYSNVSIDFHSKDSVQAASRYWLIENAELAGYNKADRESIKKWLSTETDSVRLPYATVLQDFPRRAVFVGTTNEEEMLSEPNRREWVIKVTKTIDIEHIAAIRDQIWGEAVAVLRAGESCVKCATTRNHDARCNEHSWYLPRPDELKVMQVAKEYAAPDPIADKIRHWWYGLPPHKRPAAFSMQTVMSEVLQIPTERQKGYQQSLAGRALREMGFVRRQIGTQRVWSPAAKELADAPQEFEDKGAKA